FPLTQVDISDKPSPHSLGNRAMRVLWSCVYVTLFRPSPKPFHHWRAFVLRLFGAQVPMSVHVYPRAKVWGPWNLTMGEHSTLADDVDCYCVAPIVIGSHTTISQYSYLCAATHDFEHPNFVLT